MNDEESFPIPSRLELWREAMAHLRYLNDEVWKRFQFFIWLDVALLFAIFAINKRSWPLVLLLALAGFLLTLVGRYALQRNRIYYLQMLLKKALLEEDFTFYQSKLAGTETDLAFPWRVPPEKLAMLKAEPEKWIEQNVRGKGSIARWLFVVIESFIGVFGGLVLILLFTAFR